MFTSLRSRLWLSYTFLIATALCVLVVAFGIYLWRNPLLYRQTMTRLRTVESGITRRQSELFDHSTTSTLTRVADTYDVRILLFDGNGNLIQDTGLSQPAISLPREFALNRTVPTLRDESGALWLYAQQRLENGMTVLIAAPRSRVPLLSILRDELLPIFVRGGAIALVFSLILAYAIARWVADPLQRIVTASQRVPVSETAPVHERGPREVRDLTRAFNAMIARVQRSQKSQREFVANVSHELKTPLTAIQGFAQAILDGTAGTVEERKQAAQVIFTESGRMHRMVLDLLDLARLDAGTADLKMAPMDVPALLNGIVEKFDLQAKKADIALCVDFPPELPVLVADGDRIAQVFTNLVDNALRHTPRKGRVTLQARPMGSNMEFRVADTGSGISADAMSRVFDRFYQVDRSRAGGRKQGAGLGLAIAQEIVSAHGGRISVQSQEGHGTTFVVRLPLVQPMATTIMKKK